jgi:hypothetical protein
VAYPTLEALIEASTILTEDTVDVSTLREASIAAVEEYTGQSFDSVAGSLYVDARGGNVIFLPQRLETLTGVSYAGVTWVEPDVYLSPRHDELRIVMPGYYNYYERTMREVSGELYPRWPSGRVEIVGVWGWETCPEPVEVAIRYDMEDAAQADANELSPTITAFRAMGLRDISQGNLRATIGQPGLLSPRATRLLAGYQWYGPGGELV